MPRGVSDKPRKRRIPEDKINQIREMLLAGEYQTKIAETVGVSHSTVCKERWDLLGRKYKTQGSDKQEKASHAELLNNWI